MRSIPLLMALGLLWACEVLAAHAQETNIGAMGNIVIEPVGGFVGGGAPSGPLRMQGSIGRSALSAEDRALIQRVGSPA